MKNEKWKEKLTPYDAELFVMVESLTGKPCTPHCGGGFYYIEANYEAHPDPQYILAMWDAICGRLGDRLIMIWDDPNKQCLMARIRFSKDKYPALYGKQEENKPHYYCANVYHPKEAKDGWCNALCVTWGNLERLIEFVGGGEMEASEDGKTIFHFLNYPSRVFVHASEGDYIVNMENTSGFVVMSAEEFARTYEELPF